MTQECEFAHLSLCPLEVCNCRRASTTPPWEKPHADTPTLWGNMTPEEKGALLLGWHEGKVIEVFGLLYPDMWCEDDPCFYEDCAYRIKPEPKREMVEASLCIIKSGTSLHMRPSYRAHHYGEDAAFYFTLTFDIIDGKLDPSSIKIEDT